MEHRQASQSNCLVVLSLDGMDLLPAGSSFVSSLFPRCDFFPKERISSFEFDSWLDSVDFSRYSVINVSLSTFSYPFFAMLSRHVRARHPKARIIAGGPHFFEGNVEKTISRGHADAVQLSREGMFSPISSSGEVSAIVTSSCPNSCAYCSSRKTGSSDLSQLRMFGIRRLNLYDNNPFCVENIDKSEAFLKELAMRNGSMPETVVYIDPSAVDVPRVISLFKEGRHTLSFGRETPAAVVAARLGRRFHRSPRDQPMLDSEKDVIMRIASSLPQSMIIVNYIITPWETKESIARLLSEAESLSEHRNIILRSNYLWPLPGTELSEQHKGEYLEVEDIPFTRFYHYGSLDMWDSRFLDLCTALRARVDHTPMDPIMSEYSLSMLLFASHLALGYPDDLSRVVSRIRIPELRERFRSFLSSVDTEDYSSLVYESHRMLLNMPAPAAKLLADEFEGFIKFKKGIFTD